MTEIALLPHQYRIMENTTDPVLVLLGGYGSGKTRAICCWAIHRSAANPASVPGLIVCHTLRIAKRTIVPAFRSLFDEMGVEYKIHKTDWVITWGPQRREIWIESGDTPENLSGPNVAWAALDEFGLMDQEVERRVGSRVRHPHSTLRQVLYAGTPEGGGWSYARARENNTVYAKSADNTFLPADALRRLEELYRGDPVRYAMYVEGKPMKIAGNIYTAFNPEVHIRTCDNPHDGNIHLGADFNVGFMCTPVAVYRGGEIHIIDEVVSRDTNTETHFKRVRQKLLETGLVKHGSTQFFSGLISNGKPVEIWCDASGSARKTSATTTDKNILIELGFMPRSRPSNPEVRDRIETLQHGFSSNRIYIDPRAKLCVKSIAEHDYAPNSDPPQPRKRFATVEDPLDSACDGIGYLACGVIPVTRPGIGRTG